MGSVSDYAVCPVCGMLCDSEYWYNTGSNVWDCPVCGSGGSDWAIPDITMHPGSFELNIFGNTCGGKKSFGAIEYAHGYKPGTPIADVRANVSNKTDICAIPNLEAYDAVLCDYTVANGKIGIFKWVNGFEPRFLRMASIMTDPDTGKEYLVAKESKFRCGRATLYDANKIYTSAYAKEYARQKAIYDEIASQFVDERGYRIMYNTCDVRLSSECAVRLAERIIAGEKVLNKDKQVNCYLEDVIDGSKYSRDRLMWELMNSYHMCLKYFKRLCGDLSETVKWVKEDQKQREANEKKNRGAMKPGTMLSLEEMIALRKADFEANSGPLPNIKEIHDGHPYLEVVRCYKNNDDEPYTIEYDSSEEIVRKKWNEHLKSEYDEAFSGFHKDLTMEKAIEFYEEKKRRDEELRKRIEKEQEELKKAVNEFKSYFRGAENKCYESQLFREEFFKIKTDILNERLKESDV